MCLQGVCVCWSWRNWSEVQLILKKLIRTSADHLDQPHPTMCLQCVCVCCKLRTAILFVPFLIGLYLKTWDRERMINIFSQVKLPREFTSQDSINFVFSQQFCLYLLINFAFSLIRKFWVHTLLPLLDIHKFGKNPLTTNFIKSNPNIWKHQ